MKRKIMQVKLWRGKGKALQGTLVKMKKWQEMHNAIQSQISHRMDKLRTASTCDSMGS
jgi:hypothetical protein